MRTTIDLDADLLARLRRESERTRVPFKQLLNAALRAGLAKAAAPRLPVYVLPTFGMGAPRVNLDKALAIAAQLEDAETALELERRR